MWRGSISRALGGMSSASPPPATSPTLPHATLPLQDYMEASCPQFAVGEYWDTLAYEWDGTPTHNQDAHRQRTINWITAAGGLATAFDITLKGIMHAGGWPG